MRRFEALLVKPVAFWEVDIEGATVITAWGTVGKGDRSEYEVTLGSPAEAAAYVEREIEKQRRDGFVEIKRVASAIVEDPVNLDERFTWTDRGEERYRFVSQRDERIVVEENGQRPQTIAYKSIAEATTEFGKLLVETRFEIEQARERTARWERDHAADIRKKRVAKRDKHRNAALEAQCLAAALGDRAPWAIYADWLIAQGSPLGEIAGLALGGDREGAERLLRATYRELQPPDGMIYDFDMPHGFVRSFAMHARRDCDASLEDLVEPVLLSPGLRFVDALRFGVPCAADSQATWQPTMERLVELDIVERLRELRFDAFTSDVMELSWQGFGDFSFAWPKLARLELLHLKSGRGGTLGELDLPNLRTLIRESGGLGRAEVVAIANARWPRLEHLEIWTGAGAYGATSTLGDLQPILAARGLPALRHLGVVNSELVDDLVTELARSNLLPQLHSLDLSKGIASAAFTDAIEAYAPAFRHLASIDLSENQLSDEEVARIRAVLDNVVVTDQRAIDDYEDDDDGNEIAVRFVAVGE